MFPLLNLFATSLSFTWFSNTVLQTVHILGKWKLVCLLSSLMDSIIRCQYLRKLQSFFTKHRTSSGHSQTTISSCKQWILTYWKFLPSQRMSNKVEPPFHHILTAFIIHMVLLSKLCFYSITKTYIYIACNREFHAQTIKKQYS